MSYVLEKLKDTTLKGSIFEFLEDMHESNSASRLAKENEARLQREAKRKEQVKSRSERAEAFLLKVENESIDVDVTSERVGRSRSNVIPFRPKN